MEAGVTIASQPPTTARLARPLSMSMAPWQMAWPEEEQALDTARTGPLMPNSMAMALGAALTITRGTVKGCTLDAFMP